MSFDLFQTFRELASNYLAEEQAGQPRPQQAPAVLAEKLDLTLDSAGTPLPGVLETLGKVLADTPRVGGRRFFRLLYGGRDQLATLGDLLTAVTNTPMHIYAVGGPHVLIEKTVLSRMLELVGFEDGEGTLTPGGTLSNFLAVILARNRVGDVREQGLAGGPVLTAYTSDEAHYSIANAVAHAGLGRANLRKVATDDRGRMDPSALDAAMRADRERGHRPVLVVATSGTTQRGAFDPLAELTEVAHRHEAWLHVDAALGAPVIFSPSHRTLLDGCEHVDSITWDAHKMMTVPLTCSTLLVRRNGALADSLSEPASYLFNSAWPEFDPGLRSLQCGRRNDALKLWLVWKHIGDRGYAERVDRFFALARRTADKIDRDPELELIETPQSIMVCFEAPGKSSAEICSRLESEGRGAISSANVGERRVIRLVCSNLSAEESDIDALLAEVKAVAATLPAQ